MATTDDPTADWTEPGVFEVAPGVHRIPLPLPTDGLRAVNVYAVDDGDGLVLIDSGWAITEAREQLGKALAALGCGLGDVRRFLVTHVHRDHYTLAVTLRREFGNRVSLGIGERATLEMIADPDRQPLDSEIGQLRRTGALPIAQRLQESRGEHDKSVWELPDDWLKGPADIALQTRSLLAVPTPGHTRGHLVFADELSGLLFAGDHVLPHITPSIGLEQAPAELPLGNYLNSLRLVRQRPDARLLPAHGPVADSVHARIDELLDHHAARLQATSDTLGRGADTAYEAAGMLGWTRRGRTLDELDPFNQMLAVMETAAHLDLLVAQGQLRCAERDGVVRYTYPG
ncbi:MAG: MBL fold metallo-hydrolase [Pseudonocardiaceae bacterium]|nr:MBL fold metallo-hydrolase [Pseudonocardiaceae bacterium]